ncbi:class I SAM-dependent methyltransferase [Microbacterium sp. CFH 31415]|uniref:class I SAM-dependent methyltransferase n=1 Tax=Microbacterium sp. CFH 31415 TaxID=2921732 RepID=UPI001F137D5E|nr:class I SAM-dependent methyltransferase [Microbacterium sp. CFH 31415]MCH6231721.1 class I SAM-dependent methyltransferase [Microbacterium sp. CFH 31415]
MSDAGDAEKPDTGHQPTGDSASRHSRASWRARLPWEARLREARAERDAARRALKSARAKRDDASHALVMARAERDAAHRALAEMRAERDVAREELRSMQADGDRAREERDMHLQASLDALIGESRAIHSLEKTMDRRLRFLHRELLTDIQALDQLLSRYSPKARLPAVAGWALSPAGLLALVDLIETSGAQTIVECGSGTSTLWIGYALKKLGRGRLIALEHLPEYAQKTRALISAHRLTDFVDVRLAPLSPLQTPRGEFSWYSFDSAELTEPIDVLLVDGPPGTTGPHARYPALPLLVDRLAPGALIVADDVDRRDESEILEYWLEEVPRLRRVESPGLGIEVLELAVA